jgi:hypothetical protein
MLESSMRKHTDWPAIICVKGKIQKQYLGSLKGSILTGIKTRNRKTSIKKRSFFLKV